MKYGDFSAPRPVNGGQDGWLGKVRPRGWSSQFVVLALLLALVFVTGGTSRYDTPHVILLRPAAICAAGFALTSFGWVHWRAYRPLWLLCGAITLLLAAHLVPLPPSLWQALPGREIVTEIDRLSGGGALWRPLSLFPEGTWNALYALSVPMAVLLLGAQLTERDNLALLAALIALCLASAFIGLLQVGGSGMSFYRISSINGGLFANRNHQAALLACLLVLLNAWALVPTGTKNVGRTRLALAGITALLLIPLIVVTGSRMGLVLAGVALFYCAIDLLRRQRLRRHNSWSRFAQLGVTLAAVVTVSWATIHVSRDEVFDRFGEVSKEARWPIWDTVIVFLPDYMPWGSGVGSFVPVYQIHERDEMLMPSYVNQAHNDWLDIVLTAGVPGALIALAAMVMLAIAARRAFTTSGVSGNLRRAGIGIMIILAVASLTEYPVRTPIFSAILAIAALWACSRAGGQDNPESRTADENA